MRGVLRTGQDVGVELVEWPEPEHRFSVGIGGDERQLTPVRRDRCRKLRRELARCEHRQTRRRRTRRRAHVEVDRQADGRSRCQRGDRRDDGPWPPHRVQWTRGATHSCFRLDWLFDFNPSVSDVVKAARRILLEAA